MADSESEARRIAYEWWPNAAIKGDLGQELPLPRHFEQAAGMVSEQDVAAAVVCGPEAAAHAERIQEYADAGFDHVYIGSRPSTEVDSPAARSCSAGEDLLRLETTIQEKPALTILALEGELDIASAPELDGELARIERAGSNVVALDLRALTFLDSSGLRSILAADARARKKGRQLVLVRGSDAIHRVFELARLEERLAFVDDPAKLEPEQATSGP